MRAASEVESGLPADEIATWLRQAVGTLRMAIVSNARQEARVARVAARFDVPYVHLARKPLPFGLISGARHLGVAPAELAVVGDRVLCDVVGGNLLGCLTILTRPLSPVERRPEQVLVRKIERLMLATQP